MELERVMNEQLTAAAYSFCLALPPGSSEAELGRAALSMI